MTEAPATTNGAAPGLLLDNIVHFTRLLRAAGLPVGPGRKGTASELIVRPECQPADMVGARA